MRITIFGATGETGRMLTQQALVKCHEVVAYARNPAKLEIKDNRLKIVQGELQNQTAIEDAVKGSDAVISVLGPTGASKGLPISKGMQNILQAMKKYGLKRIIATATPSAADPLDSFDLKFKLAVLMIKLFIPSAYQDIVKTAEVIRATDLDWTIVRLPILNSKPKQGKVNTGYLGEGKVNFPLSRADLADFLLAQLEDDTFIKKAPAISN
jgi:putative NADH-flavin reductase